MSSPLGTKLCFLRTLRKYMLWLSLAAFFFIFFFKLTSVNASVSITAEACVTVIL